MKRHNRESIEQKYFFRWMELSYPHLRKVCFSIPNGGSRNLLEAINLKKQGVTSGVPDVFLAFPKENFHGLFIEFKYGKNKLTSNQYDMCNRLLNNGYCVIVCYSFDEAREAVKEYINEN